jgi:hypothetical protein
MLSWNSDQSSAPNSIPVGRSPLPTPGPQFLGMRCGKGFTTRRDPQCLLSATSGGGSPRSAASG